MLPWAVKFQCNVAPGPPINYLSASDVIETSSVGGRVVLYFAEFECLSLCLHPLVTRVFVDGSDGTAFYALGYFGPINPFVCDLGLVVPVNL